MSVRPPNSAVAAGATRSRAWLLGAALVALVAFVYLRSLRGEFLWDDDTHVAANPTIVGPLGLKEIWTTARANYFPLVLTSFWVQHALWGLNPLGYHVVTVACHATCAVLLWRVLLALGAVEMGAWLGAALWALHPVQVESVAWISELKNTQSGIFFLLSMRFWLRWLDAPRRRDYALALGCAVLALLSKPSTVMLPVALALVAWWRRGEWSWRGLVPLAPGFVLSALASGWAIWEQRFNQGAIGPEWSQTWPERAVIAGRVIWFYLGKLAWPQPLSFIYSRWTIEARSVLAWLPLIAAVAAGGWLWRARTGAWRAVFFAAAFFVALLFPVLGFFDVYFFRYAYVGDHFQYLASIGPLALVGAGLARLPQKIFLPVATGLVLGWGGLAWRQTASYQNNLVLWRTTVARTPDAVMAWLNYGDVLAWARRYPEATAAYREAARLRPLDPDAHNNLGYILTLTGDPAAALPELERALALKPDLATAHNNLGNTLRALGRDAEALPHYAEAVRLRPDYAGAHNNLGVALADADRLAEAIPHLETALRAKPDSVATRESLVRTLERSSAELLSAGRATEAEAALRRAIELAPELPVLHDELGQLLRALARNREALEEFELAARLRNRGPRHP